MFRLCADLWKSTSNASQPLPNRYQHKDHQFERIESYVQDKQNAIIAQLPKLKQCKQILQQACLDFDSKIAAVRRRKETAEGNLHKLVKTITDRLESDQRKALVTLYGTSKSDISIGLICRGKGISVETLRCTTMYRRGSSKAHHKRIGVCCISIFRGHTTTDRSDTFNR